ncbi:MAG: hypothetical protein ACE5KU_02160 [Nitrososphaerales archaeon]
MLIGIFLTQVTPTVQVFYGDIDELREEVAPSTGAYIPTEWGDLPKKLRMLRVIDLTLLNESLSEIRGYGLTAEEQSLFYGNSTSFIHLDSEGKTFLMYVFWALGLANNNTILDRHAHMFENYTSPIGQAKYGSVDILRLTPEQQALVEDVTLNSYRPCCNAPTIVPDCSHGFAALGLVEFLAYRGMVKEDVFRNLLLFNAYWFTDQYVDIALFIEEQGQSWKQVNSTQILGYSYSSLEAYQTIKKYLVESNLYDPFSEKYLLDPLSRYRQPVLILLTAIFVTSTLILAWLLWRRWTPNEERLEAKDTAAEDGEV